MPIHAGFAGLEAKLGTTKAYSKGSGILMKKYLLLFAAAAAVLCFAAGCEQSSNPSYASSWAGISTISAEERLEVRSMLPTACVGSPAPIFIKALSASGAPIKALGTICSDNGGTFSNDSFETNENGCAIIEFTPSKEGISVLSVLINENAASLAIKAGAAPVNLPKIEIICTSDAIKTDAEIVLQVFAKSISGVPFAEKAIYVATNVGGLKPADSDKDAETKPYITGKTELNGSFACVYAAPSDVGVATITVLIDGALQNRTISVQ